MRRVYKLQEFKSKPELGHMVVTDIIENEIEIGTKLGIELDSGSLINYLEGNNIPDMESPSSCVHILDENGNIVETHNPEPYLTTIQGVRQPDLLLK